MRLQKSRKRLGARPRPDYVSRRRLRWRPLSRLQCFAIVTALLADEGEVSASTPHGVLRSLIIRGLVCGRGRLTEEGREAALACRMVSEKMRLVLRARAEKEIR